MGGRGQAVLDSAHQTPFDYFSWQTFIALNWPADAKGNPTGYIGQNPGALRVWESFSDVLYPQLHLDVLLIIIFQY